MGVFRVSTKYVGGALGITLAVLLTACSDGGSNSSRSSVGGSGSPSPAPESTATPIVTSTAPADTATGVGTNVKVIAVFNKDMDAGTIDDTSFTLQGASEPAIVGTVSYHPGTRTAALDPNSNLSDDTQYTAVISTAVEDTAGRAMQNEFSWTFDTAIGPDSTVPTLSSSMPVDGDTDVLRNTQITVVFSEAIDPETITAANVFLRDDDAGTTVPGTLRYINPTTVVLSPNAHLAASSDHTLTLGGAITDIAGNPLTPDTTSFTTGTEISQGPPAVDIKTANDYVILSETGISNAGTHHITGDIAVSPGSQAAFDGFNETLSADGTFATSPLVTGRLFAADMAAPTPSVLSTAVDDMRAAYTDAASRVDADFTELAAGEIGGMTLEPGLYKWSGDVVMTQDVTLEGDASDIWIFQVGNDLRLQDHNTIVLGGGALRANVFWQVAGKVVMQASSTFHGVALGQNAIIIESGARLNGKAYAQTETKLVFAE